MPVPSPGAHEQNCPRCPYTSESAVENAPRCCPRCCTKPPVVPSPRTGTPDRGAEELRRGDSESGEDQVHTPLCGTPSQSLTLTAPVADVDGAPGPRSSPPGRRYWTPARYTQTISGHPLPPSDMDPALTHTHVALDRSVDNALAPPRLPSDEQHQELLFTSSTSMMDRTRPRSNRKVHHDWSKTPPRHNQRVVK